MGPMYIVTPCIIVETIPDTQARIYAIYLPLDFIYKCQFWNREPYILSVFYHSYYSGFSSFSSIWIIDACRKVRDRFDIAII